MKQGTTWILGLAAALLVGATARAQSEGQLVVASTPPGATITVDGKSLGKAPAIAKGLLPGDHVIQADWGDGRQVTSVQKVQPGASQVVQMTAPAAAPPQVGNLVVVTEPGGAEIFVDGKSVGKAPLAAPNLTAGDHNVVARFGAGQSASGVAHVVAGASAVMQLKAPPGAAAPVVTPPPSGPPPTAAPSGPPPTGAAPATSSPITSTTPGSAPPPPEGTTPPPTGTTPATPGETPAATAPPPAATPAPTATAQPQLTETAPPQKERRKKWVVPVVVGVVVGVVVVGAAVGLGVGLTSGGNSRYGIAEF